MKILLKSLITLILISSTLFSSCSKYEDGPKISFASKKSRLCGDWKIEKHMHKGVDNTSDYLTDVGQNFVLDIEKDGGYKTTGKFPDEGTWKLGEDKDDVTFTSKTSGGIAQTFRILRLKSKELWWKQTQTNGDVDETHFVPAD